MGSFVIFKLKEPQKGIQPNKQRETPVNLFFNYGYYTTSIDGKKKYLPLKFTTGERIKPCYWKDRPVYRAKQVKEIDYQNFNTILDNIEGAVKKVYRIEKAANRLPNPDQMRDLLKKELNLIPAPLVESLSSYLERYISEMEKGIRKAGRDKTIYRSGTIRNYRSFKNKLNEYQKARGRKLDFDDVDMAFYEDFVNYFVEKQQSPNNIGKLIKILKVIIRSALTEGLHNNNQFSNRNFRVIRVTVDGIYLFGNEVEKLEKLDLSFDKYMDTIRDVFLVGVYTAQRFSDYSRIRKENIRITESGTKVIDLVQKKTGERVVIPIMPQLEAILKKYNYTLPKTLDQKVNSEIKHIARLAGITEMVVVKKIKGGMEIEKDYAKCTLVRTHTARRTGASLMYLSGVNPIDIMKITGHKTEKEFLKYICVNKDETADNLAKLSYFNRNLKIAK